ncbi:HAD family hydrolase [Agrobacterium vitis]|uniref:HAD family hydrolase n=1 Tax=Agrobacterium vitis TaxID=373 RepID=UPI0012E84591|nr:HAD family hydrolase [Agrobacterium vitis]
MESHPVSPAINAAPATIVFDLDGTLIDTAEDLVASLNYTIAAADLAPMEADDLNHLVGHGARVMIERAFSLRGRPISEDAFQPLLERFIDHYKDHMPGKSQPYPGLLDALERLDTAGHRLAVCTNKMEGLARPLLEGLNLTDRFAAITGGDTFEMRKPDAGHLLGTIAKAGGDPRRAIMVGDSRNDILVARNAGIPSIAVPFGYSDVPVADLEPDVIITHFNELTLDLVDRLLNKAN